MSKYKAKRTRIDGHYFASRKEAMRYLTLKSMQQRGEIKDLVLQPRFKLFAHNIDAPYEVQHVATYIADFGYTHKGRQIIEDVKGFKTPMYRLKKKLLKINYGIEVLET